MTLPMITQSRSRTSRPKTISAMSTLSLARLISVMAPRCGLSLSVMCANSMSRWRLETGTSHGSQVHETAMVQIGVHVGEFHEFSETLEVAVSASAFKVADKGGAVNRREDLIVAAYDNRLLRIPCALGEFARCKSAKRPEPGGIGPHDIAFDPRTCGPPDPESFRVIPEGNADIFEDPVNLGFQRGQLLLVQDIEIREHSSDKRCCRQGVFNATARCTRTSRHLVTFHWPNPVKLPL